MMRSDGQQIRYLLLFAYAGMGVSALAYEVLWTRMLGLLFGISIFGVVFTVAAFMVGLGLGSLWSSTWSRSLSVKACLIRVVAIELGIAVFAVLLPVILPLMDTVLLNTGADLSVGRWSVVQGFAALLLLLPAATAMGFAFPLALRAAEAMHFSVAEVYGVNALGGALGALLPLALLPLLGWSQAVWSVAMLGALMSLLMWVVAYQASSLVIDTNTNSDKQIHRPPWADLLAYAGVGAVALMLEILWTRQYGMVLLRTEYILAILLLVYLIGIGMGSVLSKHLHSPRWLDLMPVVVVLLVIAAQYGLAPISQWANSVEYASLATAMLWQGGAVLLMTLPVTLAFGAWLPLLTRKFDQEFSGSSGGWWYGMNSIGAGMGALLAGLVLVPWLGTSGSVLFSCALLLFCSYRWLHQRVFWLALPLIVVMMIPAHSLPQVAELLPALSESKNLALYEDAVSTTHVIEQSSGQRVLLADLQRMDASTDPTAVTVQKNQARLPLLLHPSPERVVFLGLGTGITASGSLPFPLEQRTAVELSAGAIEAAKKYFSVSNQGVTQKVQVIHDDVRRFLRSDRGHYDVIVGDLFHPDMVGRANLLSRQQFQRAKGHLTESGVFVQWLALNQFDVDTLKVVLHTFEQVFPDSMVFVDGYRLAVVGMNQGSLNLVQIIRHIEALDAKQVELMTGGEGVWTWLARYWGTIPDFASIPVQDEWAPVIEFSLPQVRYAGGLNLSETWQWMMSWKSSMDQTLRELHVPENHQMDFQRAWAASALDVRLWQAELTGDEAKAVQWAKLAMRSNPKDRWPRIALADRMFESLSRGLPVGMSQQQALLKVLEINPNHEAAMRALIRWFESQGNAQESAYWRERLKQLSPLAILPAVH